MIPSAAAMLEDRQGGSEIALRLLQSLVSGQTWLDSIPLTALITHPRCWARVRKGTPISLTHSNTHTYNADKETHTHPEVVITRSESTTALFTVCPLLTHLSFHQHLMFQLSHFYDISSIIYI